MRAINLLPKDAERARRTTPDPALLIGVAGFAIVVAAIFSMFMSASQKVQDKQGRRDQLVADLAAMDRLNPPPTVLPVQQTMAPLQAERVGAVASALSYRIPWDFILGQIALALPSGVKLTSVNATAPVSPIPEVVAAAAEEPTNLTLEGWTYAQESVALLMTRLQILPPLVRKSVTLESSTISSNESGREYYTFIISAQIRAPGVIA
jgi:Tfp pilus assembly protein PilN